MLVVWVEVPEAVEAEWVDHLRQGQAEVVSVQAEGTESLMLLDSLVMQKVVRNVVLK